MLETKLVSVKIILDNTIKMNNKIINSKQCYLVKHLIQYLVLYEYNCMAVSNHIFWQPWLLFTIIIDIEIL